MQRRTEMQPVGIFFAAIGVLGLFGVFAVMAVNHFRSKDVQARPGSKATDYDSREMYE